jgi:hypothetical protein
MAHLITQIRDDVVTKLTGLTTTGANVFTGRVHAFERTDLPCIAVDVGGESAEYVTMGYPRGISATLSVEVTAIVSLRGDFDAELNKIQLEVQQAMSADPSLSSLAVNCTFSRRERITDGKGETPIAALIIGYDVTYRYIENNPEVVG